MSAAEKIFIDKNLNLRSNSKFPFCIYASLFKRINKSGFDDQTNIYCEPIDNERKTSPRMKDFVLLVLTKLGKRRYIIMKGSIRVV
jgi:hypothetical protein